MSASETTVLGEGYELCNGRYRLERPLGVGGMASVWLGRDQRLDRPVAVKVLADNFATDPGYVQRFRREARLAARLSHPNLVRVYDFEPDGRPALVMEYIEGGTLDESTRDPGTVVEPEALATQLLGALEHIHGAGIVHRDVKPANVLIDDDGRALLTDFGIAQPEDATKITKTGEVIGTLGYMAPEVQQGERATPRSDLYSVGVVLRDHLRDDASESLRRLVERLTDPNPSLRPPSARRALSYLARPASRLAADSDAAVVQTVEMDEAEVWDEPVTAEHEIEQEDAAGRDEPEPRDADEPEPRDTAEPEPRDTAGWDALSEPLARTGPREPREERELEPRSQLPPPRREYAIDARHVLAGLVVLAVVIAAIALVTSGGSEDGGTETAAGGSGEAASGSTPQAEDPAAPADEAEPAPSATGVVPEPKPNADPEKGSGLEQEAYALLQSGDAEAAVKAYEKALREFPAEARTPEAFAEYPSYAYALYSYADALLQTGRAEEAVAVLQERLAFEDQRDTVEALLAEAEAAAG